MTIPKILMISVLLVFGYSLLLSDKKDEGVDNKVTSEVEAASGTSGDTAKIVSGAETTADSSPEPLEETSSFFSKLKDGTYSKDALSYTDEITTSPPWQALYELLGAGVAATLILWALLILIVLWVVKTILVILRNFSLEKKNKKEVFTIGITGKLAITLLVFGFFFSVFIAFTDGGKFNTRTFVNVRLDQLSVGGTEVKTMDFATTAKVMLPRTRVTDGVTINVACAEIIEPSHILDVEGIPKIHITSVTTSSGNTRDFEIPKEMREFLGSMGVSKVKVKFTLVQSTIHRTSAEDCPHS